jgi:hypothetical protein
MYFLSYVRNSKEKHIHKNKHDNLQMYTVEHVCDSGTALCNSGGGKGKGNDRMSTIL